LPSSSTNFPANLDSRNRKFWACSFPGEEDGEYGASIMPRGSRSEGAGVDP